MTEPDRGERIPNSLHPEPGGPGAKSPGVNRNLIALLLWLGYRREYVVYERRVRLEGKSAWTAGKKLRYALNSIFNFTDLPVQVLLYSGTIGLVLACSAAILVLVAKLRGDIPVPGYTPIVLAILFFGALTNLGFGIIGQYLWLALQNTRRRPSYLVHSAEEHGRPDRRFPAESRGRPDS